MSESFPVAPTRPHETPTDAFRALWEDIPDPPVLAFFVGMWVAVSWPAPRNEGET